MQTVALAAAAADTGSATENRNRLDDTLLLDEWLPRQLSDGLSYALMGLLHKSHPQPPVRLGGVGWKTCMRGGGGGGDHTRV